MAGFAGAVFRFGRSAGWVVRRMMGGFVAGAIGFLVLFGILRALAGNAPAGFRFVVGSGIGGIFLGTVSGALERSTLKTFLGGLCGGIGAILGGLAFSAVPSAATRPEVPPDLGWLAVRSASAWTWALAGLATGLASGLMERTWGRVLAGGLFGLVGGAVAGGVGYEFYASLLSDLAAAGAAGPAGHRLAEAAFGGTIGLVLWFFIGLAERAFVFRRRLSHQPYKTCDRCRAQNPLEYWYCSVCGAVLQEQAPASALAIPSLTGLERVSRGLRFLGRILSAAGVLAGGLLFLMLLPQSPAFALLAVLLAAIGVYAIFIGLQAAADLLEAWMRFGDMRRGHEFH